MRGLALTAFLFGLAACAAEPGADRAVSSTDPLPPARAQPSGPTADCPITGSSGWDAWVNAMPGSGRPKLIVVGKVQVASGGHEVLLQAGPIREIHPPVQEIVVKVTAPRGGATGALVQHDARIELPALDSYGGVVVRCGDRTLATINNIIRAF